MTTYDLYKTASPYDDVLDYLDCPVCGSDDSRIEGDEDGSYPVCNTCHPVNPNRIRERSARIAALKKQIQESKK